MTSLKSAFLLQYPTLLAVNLCFSALFNSELELNEQPVGTTNLIVRPARHQDLSAMAEILADSFHPPRGIGQWLHPLMRLGIYEDLRNRLRLASNNYLCLVAAIQVVSGTVKQNCLAGTVEMALRSPGGAIAPSPWGDRGKQYPYISNLAVKAEFRRQGVARELLLACDRAALEWGMPDLYLHVLENNHQARQLYLQAGYKVQKVESNGLARLLCQPRKLFLHKHLHRRETY